MYYSKLERVYTVHDGKQYLWNNKALDLKQLAALFGQMEYLSPSLKSQHTADIFSEPTMTKPKKWENPNFKPKFFENYKSQVKIIAKTWFYNYVQSFQIK